MLSVIKNSLTVAFFGIIITTVLSLIIIFIRGYLPKKIKGIVDIIVTLPLFIPPSVSGYFILSVFGVQGFIGKPLYEIFGIRFIFTLYSCSCWGDSCCSNCLSKYKTCDVVNRERIYRRGSSSWGR